MRYFYVRAVHCFHLVWLLRVYLQNLELLVRDEEESLVKVLDSLVSAIYSQLHWN